VEWTVASSFTKASFVLDGEKMEAFYSLDGAEIGVSKTIALEKLPENALRNITQKYPFPPYKLKECIQFTTDKETVYYVSLEEETTKLILEISASGFVDVFKKEKIK
jgi:hypothetical protein